MPRSVPLATVVRWDADPEEPVVCLVSGACPMDAPNCCGVGLRTCVPVRVPAMWGQYF